MNYVNRCFSEEELDFLREMMNIGAGNAATAFSEILGCQVDLIIPNVYKLSIPNMFSIFHDPYVLVTCAKMEMHGDVRGNLFFIVQENQKRSLIRLVEKTLLKSNEYAAYLDHSLLGEIGNIITGAYLTAIHDFCGLKIYHSAPILTIDVLQSILDKSVVTLNHQVQEVILIENEFIIIGKHIVTFLLIFPSKESFRVLIDSLHQAKMKYGFG